MTRRLEEERSTIRKLPGWMDGHRLIASLKEGPGRVPTGFLSLTFNLPFALRQRITGHNCRRPVAERIRGGAQRLLSWFKSRPGIQFAR